MEPEPRRRTTLWLLAGVLGGLAMLSKYQGVFLFVGTLVFLATVPRYRTVLMTWGPWLGAVAGLLVFAPVIVWNLQHDFVSLRFQSGRLGGGGVSATRVLVSLAEQAAYMGVWNVAPMVTGLYAALRSGPAQPRTWFPALVAIGPIVLFTLATLWSPGLPHWTAQGWLFALPLAGAVAARWSRRAPRFMATSIVGAAVVLALFLVVAVGQVTTGWASRWFPTGWSDVTRDLVNWTELRDGLDARGLDGPVALVAAPHWIQAGKVSYALGPDVEVLCLCDRPQHFAYRYDLHDLAGRDVTVVVQRDGPGSSVDLGRYFDSIESAGPPIVVHRLNGDPALTLDVFVGRGLIVPK